MLSWINTTKKYIKNVSGFVDFDICMAHFVLPGGEVAHWLKKHYNLPYALISHGHEIPWVHPRQMFFFHLGTYSWIKKVSKHSEINFIQTLKMKNNIDSFMGKRYSLKNVIVPNGIDTRFFQPDLSKRGRKLRIVFVGRLVIQKDPMTFMKALGLLKNEIDFEVHITGDGNLREKMERFVRKNGLANEIKFLGKVTREQMLDEYQAAHLMVAPSLNEGMSIAALEALNCGVYLIATRASGFEDMINEGIDGEFCGFGDANGLAGAIRGFYQNKFNKQNGGIKPRISRDSYGWDNIVQDYLEKLRGI
jgi:glycosyltransferase involved in cell wall biosynthesis